MRQNLVRLREQVMDRVDRALDSAWPGRTGDEYVQEMQWAAGQLAKIASDMQSKCVDQVEQSRTYSNLGSVYSDLAPALGKEMLLKAKRAYQAAEKLLEGKSDDLVRAKLNFNFGNTLRQMDPTDIEQLQEARRRFLHARTYFAVNAPQYLAQVDAALQSVESLLKTAPIANTVKQNMDDMEALQKHLEISGDVSKTAQKAREIMKRGGGVAGIMGRLQTIIDALPEDQKRNEKFTNIQKQMQDLTTQALGNNEMTPEVKQIWSLLNDRLKFEAGSAVPKDRAESMQGVMEEFGRILSGDEKDVQALLTKLQRMREFAEDRFEVIHYLSHGIERPPAGSRGADLVELNWQLRRYLLEEMNRPEKGEEESKEALDLSVRASRVDRRIYEAAGDNGRAMTVEREELRPLALAIRNFSARMHTMPARPVWRAANVPADANAVFYSGPEKGKAFIAATCRSLGLEVMAEPRGESYASARWKQLQKGVTAIFDLRPPDASDMAATTYELGVALSLGRPIVVLVAEDQRMPFDVDIDPVVLVGGLEDDGSLATAIDRSVVWTYPRPHGDASSRTLEHILSVYQRPQRNIYVDQSLRMLRELREAPDPLAITRTLMKLFDYLKDGETMLIHPRWPPVYPEEKKLRLFHVMPFGPGWAGRVTSVTREVCETAGVKYVRGDEVDEPNVIRSIWEEIAQATHVLVDLTGFNPNVGLELGIAHTLGKNVMMVGQDDTVDRLFPSIQKLRVQNYDSNDLEKGLGSTVRKFVLS